ncbi:hypothetical protein P43SY_005626 [Pythium insidiosum]|uniref:Uncharacterized protein n=1 Tax=Pythium insidiosum TaxID=114742 RepID=A0AAD5Q5J9_PYTIN|nr:hypothetical protein P43SY_005626 [Pythium insidiosum]
MNVTEIAALLATLNASLALAPSNSTIAPGVSVTDARDLIASLNETIARGGSVNETALNMLNASAPGVPAPAPSATALVGATKGPTAQQLAARAATLAYLKSRFHTLQLFLLAGYGIMCMLCLLLILYLRFNRHTAFKGDMNAARKVILPAFEPLLIVIGLATGTYTVFFCVALATELYEYNISKLATEVFYSGRQFVFLSVVVFMLQKSVSGPALRRSVLLTFLLATYTLPIVWYMEHNKTAKQTFYVVLTATRSLMLILYTVLRLHVHLLRAALHVQ